MKLRYGLILAFLAVLGTGCEQLGIETPAAEAAREEAEGKAIGSACRQSARPLEECYQLNRRAPKAAIFNGWREMDAYMRENKIADVKPEPEAKEPEAKSVAPTPVAPVPEPSKPEPKAASGEPKPAPAKAEKAAEAKPAEARRSRPALAR